MWCSIALLTVTFTLAPAAPVKAKGAQRVAGKPSAKLEAEPLAEAPELRGALEKLGEPVALSASERKQLLAIAQLLKSKNEAAALERWQAFVRNRGTQDAAIDAYALVAYVLQKSYLENNEDLASHAGKVAYFNAQKAALRKYIRELRDATADKDAKQKLTFREFSAPTKYARGAKPVAIGRKATKAVEEWTAYGARLEERLQSVGDDAQLANVDLQNSLQKQQHALQMLSNISKSLHDTAKAIIDNLKG